MAGRCPSCNQVYSDDSLSFCPNDGTPLNREAAPAYDPKTLVAPPPPTYQPQQPGGYYPPPGGSPPPQGEQPPPAWQPPYDQQQHPPPYGQQQYAPQYGAGGGKSSKMPLIIGAAAVVLIGVGIGLYFMLRGDSSSSSNSSKVDIDINTPSNTSRTTSTIPTIPTPGTYSTPSTTTSTSTGSYSEDEKHRLFQAVGITRDNALIIEVAQKIGISDSSGNPNSEFQSFVKEHFNWAMKNTAWVQEYRDPAKARAYVMANK